MVDILETVRANMKLNLKLWNHLLVLEIQKERVRDRNLLNAYKSANEVFQKHISSSSNNKSKGVQFSINGRKHEDYR